MKGVKGYQAGLFDYERPIAQQTSIIANQQRDPKKQKKPFSLEDFSFYIQREDRNLPAGAYGSAALRAIKEELFPSWALFCYQDLANGADQAYSPENPILVCEDAILLHPVKTPGGVAGMLIAQESASEHQRVMRDVEGRTYRVIIPYIETKVVAIEDVTLSLR